jgi:hypothetical protein
VKVVTSQPIELIASTCRREKSSSNDVRSRTPKCLRVSAADPDDVLGNPPLHLHVPDFRCPVPKTAFRLNDHRLWHWNLRVTCFVLRDSIGNPRVLNFQGWYVVHELHAGCIHKSWKRKDTKQTLFSILRANFDVLPPYGVLCLLRRKLCISEERTGHTKSQLYCKQWHVKLRNKICSNASLSNFKIPCFSLRNASIAFFFSICYSSLNAEPEQPIPVDLYRCRVSVINSLGR